MTSATSGTASGPGGEPAGLSGVAAEVTNAVAPFDHESNVDSQLLPALIDRLRGNERQYLAECMAAEGFDWQAPGPPPARDDPMLISNWQFPPIDLLAAQGFPHVAGTPSSPEDFQERPEYDQATLECGAQIAARFGSSPAATAYDLFAALRSAWEEVLAEIDGLDEIRALSRRFAACLRDEGIPNEYTGSEITFLNYVDFLLAEAHDDAGQEATIRERYGRLYAECSRDLFTAREQLRSGERRAAFLTEHEEAIRQLALLLEGAGSAG